MQCQRLLHGDATAAAGRHPRPWPTPGRRERRGKGKEQPRGTDHGVTGGTRRAGRGDTAPAHAQQRATGCATPYLRRYAARRFRPGAGELPSRDWLRRGSSSWTRAELPPPFTLCNQPARRGVAWRPSSLSIGQNYQGRRVP